MYEPKFEISNSLLNNIVKLEVTKSKIESAQVQTKVRNNLVKRAKSLNLFHMGHQIGLKLTLKDATKVAEGKTLVTEDARGKILNNFRNILEFTRSNISDSYLDIDLSIIMHLNKILITDWRETWEAKLRTGGEEIDLNLENWSELRDKTIDAIQIQNEIIALLDWYKANASKVNNLIRIGVFAYRLVQICPFILLNKLSVISVVDFLLYKNGYVDKCYTPTVRNFDVYEDEYMEAWSQSNLNGTGDMTLWLERFVRNLANDMQETEEEMKKLANLDDKGQKRPFLDLNKRQLKILRYLQTIPTLKREDYVQMMDVSTMTAYRDLDELLAKNLIKTEGRGRGTKYMLSSR